MQLLFLFQNIYRLSGPFDQSIIIDDLNLPPVYTNRTASFELF